MVVFDYEGNIVNNPVTSVPWISAAHRGYSSATVHENTLPAYYRAWLNGANMIETDVRLTSDNVYVISHDATVTVGGTTHTIAEETSKTLTSLVLSTDTIYGECKIPTLENVLKLALYTGMKVNLDCKVIDASTLAKLVVDCGMSGRAIYGGTNQENAATILTIDPNAGFVFGYENMQWWLNVLSDYHVRQKSYAWAPSISEQMLKATRAEGFKFLLNEQSTTNNMHYVPDCIEFISTANINVLNQSYLDSLDLI